MLVFALSHPKAMSYTAPTAIAAPPTYAAAPATYAPPMMAAPPTYAASQPAMTTVTGVDWNRTQPDSQ